MSGIVDLLINCPPKLAISHLVNSLKGERVGYSAEIALISPNVITTKTFVGHRVIFAESCDGAPISAIRQYIEQQQTPG
ncbi:TPA: transposase [Klebsiella aerogenes]|nr:transposase [Klebsiella aerogenes]HCR0084152.1 transposase [Klebsiella aerogenes]HCR0222285.1 transposase [Klebsiella aerogenes]HCR0512040.1 transposase [Klebsiella aerogenes]HCU2335216.1 transposase [Klebsiella aerogenes]